VLVIKEGPQLTADNEECTDFQTLKGKLTYHSNCCTYASEFKSNYFVEDLERLADLAA
jgi:hypothetical protein